MMSWTGTARAAWTSSRKRWRPRSMASGAGAGPNTAMFSWAGAARPIRRAVSFASAWLLAGDDDRGEAAEGGHGGLAAGVGLGGVEALAHRR